MCNMNKRICSNRTKIETILITTVVILISILIILIVLLAQRKESPENVTEADAKTCHTQTCLKEALNILNRIDTNVNPCEDFYAFACNNVESHRKDEDYGPFKKKLKEFKNNLEEMYLQPENQLDHAVVNVQKKLYRICINETEVEKDAFKTIQDALIYAGGWPVLEGHQWNEANFEWVQATYKLRSLGYLFSIFLNVNIVVDPMNKDKYILKVSIPEVEDVYSKYFNSDETNGFMADVAVAFGAEMHRALGEMTQTAEFLLDLQWIQNSNEASEEDEDHHRMTIAEIQRKHGTINWLNFINEIIGEKFKLSYNDYVLFPHETFVDSWMGVLIKAPKRLLANYMMWRVVEDNLQFVTSRLRNEKVQPKLRLENNIEERSEYCMQLLRHHFSPSPVEIMYLRKYLPKEKVQKALNLIQNFMSELKNTVRELPWIEEDTKVQLYNNIDNVKIVLGAPGDYLDDAVFENMNFNITVTSFVNTLAQVNNNNLNQLYGLIDKSPKSTKLSWWKLSMDLQEQYHDPNTLELNQNIFYNENRPNYMNYGIMGLVTKNIMYKLVGASYDWLNKSKCALNTTGIPDYLIYQPLSHLLSTSVSYNAYKSIAQESPEEPLFPLDYNPAQLFWISAGEIYCYYINPSFNLDNATKEAYNTMMKNIINRNQEIISDFSCNQILEDQCSFY